MKIKYRNEFCEQIRELNDKYTASASYCLESLIYTLFNVCSITDLERILEEYELQIGE